MKQWFGAFLCMAFGSVLIVSGLSSGGAADGGVAVPTCQLPVGIVIPCPTGTITVTEVTHQLGHPLTLPAGGWKVDITSSNCTAPSGATLAMTLTIADGGNATSGPLFVFTSPAHSTSCSYTLVEHPVTGFTAAFVPTSPVTITWSGGTTNSNRAVTVTNASNAPTPSSPASSTRASSSAAPTSASASAPLAATGPRKQIGVTLYFGIALVGLGLVLVVAGRRQRRGGHSQ